MYNSYDSLKIISIVAMFIILIYYGDPNQKYLRIKINHPGLWGF